MKRSSFRFATVVGALCATSMALTPVAMAQDDACATTSQSLASGGSAVFDTTGLGNLAAPACSGSGGNDGSDIWISLTGLTPGNNYEVETLLTGTIDDTSIEVFDACGGTAIACNDDKSGADYMSLATFTASAGTHFLLANSDWNNLGTPATGDFTVTLTDLGAPASDGICGTTSLTLASGATLVVDTTGLGNSAAPSCSGSGGSDGEDVWVELTGLTPGNQYSVETFQTGTIDDTSIEVFDACGGTSLGCNDDKGGGDYMSLATFTASATSHYLFANSDWTNLGTPAGGDFTIELLDLGVAPTLETAADTCADISGDPVAEVTGADLPFHEFYDGAAARTDSGDWRGADNAGTGGTGGLDSWWSFTPSSTGNYTASLGFDDGSAVLSVWTADVPGDPCNNTFTELGTSAFANPPDRVEQTMGLTAGTTYYFIYEDAFSGSAPGDFDFSIAEFAFPMDCATAPSIDPGSLPVVVNGNNTGSSPTHALEGVYTGADDFYTFAPTVDGVYHVDVTGADSDAFIYESNTLCADLEAVFGEFPLFEDAQAAGLVGYLGLIGDETVRFRGYNGNDYTIVIDDYDGFSSGAYTMTVDSVGPLVANDECTDPGALTSGVPVSHTTAGTVNDIFIGGVAQGGDTFHLFTATADGTLEISADGTTSGFDLSIVALVNDCVNLAFFTGSSATSVADLEGPAARAPEVLSLPVVNGDEVLIMIGSPDASEGAYDITASFTAGVSDWMSFE